MAMDHFYLDNSGKGTTSHTYNIFGTVPSHEP